MALNIEVSRPTGLIFALAATPLVAQNLLNALGCSHRAQYRCNACTGHYAACG